MMAQHILQTPDNWGETCYLEQDDMDKMVHQLIEAGGEDWEDIDSGDCGTLEIVKDLGDGRGAYEGVGSFGWITDGYNRNGRREVVILKKAKDGSYEYETSYDPKTDAEELEELGIE